MYTFTTNQNRVPEVVYYFNLRKIYMYTSNNIIIYVTQQIEVKSFKNQQVEG